MCDTVITHAHFHPDMSWKGLKKAMQKPYFDAQLSDQVWPQLAVAACSGLRRLVTLHSRCNFISRSR